MYNYQNTGGIAPPPEMHIEAANQMAESIINDFPFDQQAAMVKHIAHRVKESLENLIETKRKEIEILKKCSSDLGVSVPENLTPDAHLAMNW